MAAVDLSIVIPCYNEKEGLPELVRRTMKVVSALPLSVEILLIDDGSSDHSWEAMLELQKSHSVLSAVKLARNHGHQLALSAGLSLCRATQYILVMDADLQDPPELLPEMLECMRKNHADVVYGQRTARAGESWFKLFTAKCFYRFLRFMTEVDIPADAGDFRLMKRHVVDTLNQMPEHSRFLRGMVSWTGGIQIPLRYHRAPRYAGKTKYPVSKMFKLAYDAITSFSVRPLKIGIKLGSLGMIAGVLVLLYTLIAFFLGKTVQGWTSIIAVIVVFSSFQIFMLGVIGEYIGRIFIETQKRPLFLISEVKMNDAK